MELRGITPGPLPAHVAKAYGVIAKPATASNPSGATARLVAGTVSVPADPALAPTMDAQGAFALYNRAADRVEVATRVALGTAVDTRA